MSANNEVHDLSSCILPDQPGHCQHLLDVGGVYGYFGGGMGLAGGDWRGVVIIYLARALFSRTEDFLASSALTSL